MSDALWKIVEPLLPVELPEPKGGQPRARSCLFNQDHLRLEGGTAVGEPVAGDGVRQWDDVMAAAVGRGADPRMAATR